MFPRPWLLFACFPSVLDSLSTLNHAYYDLVAVACRVADKHAADWPRFACWIASGLLVAIPQILQGGVVAAPLLERCGVSILLEFMVIIHGENHVAG